MSVSNQTMSIVPSAYYGRGPPLLPDMELATGGVDSLSGSFLCVAGIHRACNSCTAVLLVHDVDLVIGPDSTFFTDSSTVEAFGY